jgi:hypothetical protein
MPVTCWASGFVLSFVFLLACLGIILELAVQTGILALAAITSAYRIAMNATLSPNDICSTSARSLAWASTSARLLTSTRRSIVSVLASIQLWLVHFVVKLDAYASVRSQC